MLTIYWTKQIKNHPDIEKRIREKFRLGTYKSVNGETPVERELSDKEMELLRQVEQKGYIQIRQKEI